MSKLKNLIVFITTAQSPHFEAGFHYAIKNEKLYKKIYFIDIFSNISYRHEYTWRDYYSLLANISRKIRNGMNKNLNLKFKKYTYSKKFRFINLKSRKDIKKNDNLIKDILTTYSCNEHGNSVIKKTKYDENIIKSIYETMSITQNFVNKYKVTKKDDFLLFNGRLPSEYGVKEVLLKKKLLNIIYHECNVYQKKIYFLRHSIHKLEKYDKEIYDYYLRNKKKALDDWLYLKKVKFKKKKFNYITYFTSSNDEYKFTYKKPVNQSVIIKKLLNLNLVNHKLKIRVHPNTITKSYETKKYWDHLKKLNPNIFINYNEKISSEDLCRKSFLTLSIGSSVAAESLIFDTPHLLIGKQHWYVNLPGYYKCSEKNLKNYIEKFLIKNKNKKKIFFLIKDKHKFIAAASLLFLKAIGEKVNLVFLGKFPPLGTIGEKQNWEF